MHTFHKLLSRQHESQDPRLKALFALTKISPAELLALTNGLTWQPW